MPRRLARIQGAPESGFRVCSTIGLSSPQYPDTRVVSLASCLRFGTWRHLPLDTRVGGGTILHASGGSVVWL